MTSTAIIDAPHFMCAIVINGGVVIQAAPIVKYMNGWTVGAVKDYCAKKGWKYDKATDFH